MSEVYLETLFTDKDWQVIGAANMKELYYARHDCKPAGDRSWMCYWQRNCANCDTRVPDSIQTVLRLLVSSSKYVENKV